MAALLKLALSHYNAQAVLLAGKSGAADAVPGIRITVFGPHFPIRAIQPEILVGEVSAEWVEVSRDQHSVRGYLRKTPPEGVRIIVRYGDSQEGELEQRFDPKKIHALPRDCR